MLLGRRNGEVADQKANDALESTKKGNVEMDESNAEVSEDDDSEEKEIFV